MSTEDTDWLRRFPQAGMYQELQVPFNESQNQSQPQNHNAPERSQSRGAQGQERTQQRIFGVPSPYEALMHMTNNNPERFFGAAQAGKLRPEVAATLQRGQRMMQSQGLGVAGRPSQQHPSASSLPPNGAHSPSGVNRTHSQPPPNLPNGSSQKSRGATVQHPTSTAAPSRPSSAAPPPHPASPNAASNISTPMYHPKPKNDGTPKHATKKRRIENGPPQRVENGTPKPKGRPKGSKSAPNLSAYSYAPSKATDTSYLRHRNDMVQPFNKEDAAEKIYDPKTIARDILITAGRHPTENSLNQHLRRLQDLFRVDFTADLETFRWDLVEQGPPLDPPQASQPQEEIKPQAAIHQLQVTGFQPQQSQPQPHRVSHSHSHPPIIPTEQLQPLNSLRPPSGLDYRSYQSSPQPSQPPQPHAKHAPTVQLSKQFPHAQESRSTSKMPGRKPTVEVKVPAPTMRYHVYRCRWKDCKAELHNLATLRQHMLKVHVPYKLNCEWAGCPTRDIMAAAALYEHVNTKHIEPVAWKLGDGPSVPATGKDTTTDTGPLTRPDRSQLSGEDTLMLPASTSSIRAFNLVHGKHTARDRAQEIVKAVQTMKQRIGVGLDKGGCELATPARNARVVNDEEFYEVVSDS